MEALQGNAAWEQVPLVGEELEGEPEIVFESLVEPHEEVEGQ